MSSKKKTPAIQAAAKPAAKKNSAKKATAKKATATEAAPASNKLLTASEIAFLRSLPKEYEAAPDDKLADAVQNAKNAQRAFELYEDQLVEGSELGKDAGKGLAAARELFEKAERGWAKARSNVPSVAEARKEGEKLKSAMLSALRYFFRADRIMLARCSKIVEGTGDVDLGNDLTELAELFGENSAKLKKAKVPKNAIARAGELAAALGSGVTTRKVNPEQADAFILRNRAFHAMEAGVDEILEAGRYVFAGEPKHKKAFRRLTRRARKDPNPE